MTCITDSMRWFDWASVGLLYVLGTWKLIDLLRYGGNKFEKWLDSPGLSIGGSGKHMIRPLPSQPQPRISDEEFFDMILKTKDKMADTPDETATK